MAAAEKETPNEGVQIVVRLDDLLHERRMTLTELAERIGITLANLSILKTGKVLFLRVDFGDHLGSRLFPVEPQLRLGLVVRLLVPEEHRLEAVFVFRTISLC